MKHLLKVTSRSAKEAWYRGAIDTMLLYLDLTEPITLPNLLCRLENVRHRGLDVQPYAHIPLPFTGLTITTSSSDLIYYRADLSPIHVNQVVCHEIVHLLQGHQRLPLSQANVRTLGINTFHRRQLVGCSTYDQEEEFEAEYSGTYLASKLDPVSTWDCKQIANDYAVLEPLHVGLRPFAPHVYLNTLTTRSKACADYSRLAMARILAEITDARLRCYTNGGASAYGQIIEEGIDLADLSQRTLTAVALWEAALLQRQPPRQPFPLVPVELSTAPYQSLGYYRLLAAALEQITPRYTPYVEVIGAWRR